MSPMDRSMPCHVHPWSQFIVGSPLRKMCYVDVYTFLYATNNVRMLASMRHRNTPRPSTTHADRVTVLMLDKYYLLRGKCVIRTKTTKRSAIQFVCEFSNVILIIEFSVCKLKFY